MGLTFPRELPDFAPEKFDFRIQRYDGTAPEAGGRLGSIQTGFPLWQLTVDFGPGLLPAQSEEWQAFIDSLNGAANLFYGRSYTRDYPEAYPNGFDGMVRASDMTAFPGEGTATSWTPSSDRTSATLDGLPAHMDLTYGDLIGFRWGGDTPRHTCVRVMESHDAGGDGSATWEVRPALSRVIPSDAVAYLHQPSCLMRMDTTQTKVDGMGRDRVITGSFVAIQDLLP